MDCHIDASASRVTHQARPPHLARIRRFGRALSDVAEPPAFLSPSEEFVNWLTHACGTLASIVGAVVLISAAATEAADWLVAGCAIYSGSLIAVYAASTLSHAVAHPPWRSFFRRADQAAIYLLIAGTYTPFGLAHVCHDSWWLLLAAMWAVALVGFCSKLLWGHRVEAVSVLTYVVLGWLPITAFGRVVEAVPWPAMMWILAGGLCYTLGTIFLIWDRKVRYFHAVWHLFVIAGSTCHYLVTFYYVVSPLREAG